MAARPLILPLTASLVHGGFAPEAFGQSGGAASLSLSPSRATTDLVIGGAIGRANLRGWKSPRLVPSTATTDLVIGGRIGVLK